MNTNEQSKERNGFKKNNSNGRARQSIVKSAGLYMGQITEAQGTEKTREEAVS